MKTNNNIILNQLIIDGSLFLFKELIPTYSITENTQSLVRNAEGDIFWSPIDLCLNTIVNNLVKDTNIYYDKGRIGVGRKPLFNYTVDVAIPKNTRITALHIGDGSFGFSLGNGTNSGFLPEIIGIGNDETDAGLYFVGIAGNDVSSSIPLIVFDGRSTFNTKVTNRPLLGITSGNYNEYVICVDSANNLNVKGNVSATDIVINNESLLKIIENLQKQINELK